MFVQTHALSVFSFNNCSSSTVVLGVLSALGTQICTRVWSSMLPLLYAWNRTRVTRHVTRPGMDPAAGGCTYCPIQ